MKYLLKLFLSYKFYDLFLRFICLFNTNHVQSLIFFQIRSHHFEHFDQKKSKTYSASLPWFSGTEYPGIQDNRSENIYRQPAGATFEAEARGFTKGRMVLIFLFSHSPWADTFNIMSLLQNSSMSNADRIVF
jgi:hypothetical protein